MRASWIITLGVAVGCGASPGVAPGRGRVSGGDAVRITGEGFLRHGAPVAYVGPRAAKGIVIESDRSMLLVTPEGEAPGVVDVAVHFADGTVLDWPAAFEYESRGVVLRKD